MQADNKEFVEFQKKLVSKIILPCMGAMALILLLTHFKFERNEIIGSLVLVFGTAINIFVTAKNRKLRIGPWTLQTHSDLSDEIRWVINFVVADVLIWTLFDTGPLGVYSGFVLLLISSMADTFNKSSRIVVMVVGYLVFSALLWHQKGDLEVSNQMYAHACMILTLIVFWSVEAAWKQSLIEQRLVATRENDLKIENEKLRYQALLGSQSRVIAHEINNLICLIDVQRSTLDSIAAPENEAVLGISQSMSLTIKKIAKVNELILTEAYSERIVQTSSLSELVDDIKSLLGKYVIQCGGRLNVDVGEDAIKGRFRERSGTTFLIIYNLVKNSCEALALLPGQHPFVIEIGAIKNGGDVAVSVSDRGAGMKPYEVDSILNRDDSNSNGSKKIGGHGMGMRFVLDECRLNGFKASIDSKENHGTRTTISIPLI